MILSWFMLLLLLLFKSKLTDMFLILSETLDLHLFQIIVWHPIPFFVTVDMRLKFLYILELSLRWVIIIKWGFVGLVRSPSIIKQSLFAGFIGFRIDRWIISGYFLSWLFFINKTCLLLVVRGGCFVLLLIYCLIHSTLSFRLRDGLQLRRGFLLLLSVH